MSTSKATIPNLKTSLDSQAVENFREYLRIPSVHPDARYDGCVAFIENQAKDLGLPIRIYEYFPAKPVVVVTWVGQEPNLPSILLNSHMDVVAAYEEEWSYPPFEADVDEEGNIYARGAQDMKSVGIQYLEAIRKLMSSGVTLKRTVHVSFVPDEEIGSVQGMQAFAKSEDFMKLNVGFAMDEGGALDVDAFAVFYGERTAWQLLIHCPGQSGHGSQLIGNTAAEKVRKIMDNFYDFRTEEVKKLEEDPTLLEGDVTSVNVTQMEGGVQPNVIPPEFQLVVDCRIAITRDLPEFEEMVNRWCKEAGEGVWFEFLLKHTQAPVTNLDESNPYWVAFKEAADNLNMNLVVVICPGFTDARFVRGAGKSAIGFSPMNYTVSRVHTKDEYLNTNTFLRGIDLYCSLISAIANVSE